MDSHKVGPGKPTQPSQESGKVKKEETPSEGQVKKATLSVWERLKAYTSPFTNVVTYPFQRFTQTETKVMQQHFLKKYQSDPWKNKVAGQVFRFLGPELCSSGTVLASVRRELGKILDQIDEKGLKEFSLFLDGLKGLKQSVQKRIYTEEPVSAFDKQAFKLQLNLIGLIAKNDKLGSAIRGLGYAFLESLVPMNLQILSKGIPLLFFSVKSGKKSNISGLGRYCYGLLLVEDRLSQYKKGTVDLTKEEQSLFASQHLSRNLLVYERHTWQMMEGTTQENGNRIPKKSVCTLGVAIPGVSVCEAKIELDITPLKLVSFERTKQVIELIKKVFDTRVGYDLFPLLQIAIKKNPKITWNGLVSVAKGLKEGEIQKELGKNLQYLNEPGEEKKRLGDLIGLLEDFQKTPALRYFSSEQIKKFFFIVNKFLKEMSLIYPRLLFTAHFPKIKSPSMIKNVTKEFFNQDVYPLLDQTEKLLERKLIDSSSLRAFYAVLKTSEARTSYKAFLTACLEAKQKNLELKKSGGGKLWDNKMLLQKASFSKEILGKEKSESANEFSLFLKELSEWVINPLEKKIEALSRRTLAVLGKKVCTPQFLRAQKELWKNEGVRKAWSAHLDQLEKVLKS